MAAPIVFALLVLALGGCAIVANRLYVPPAREDARIRGSAAGPGPGDALTVTTWNLGYAGMGRESDFVMDLGSQRRPPAPGLVDKNLALILSELETFETDIFLFQEVARPSWVNYRRDVLGAVIRRLPGHAHVFGADVDTRLVPPPINVEVGNAIFSRLPLRSAERRGLPLEPTFEFGVFRKGYRMHIVRLGEDRDWVIVNIHLSTFDSAEHNVREAQVRALLAFAEEEYRQGRHVVIGGDWNLRLAPTEFPHRTEERFRFWIRDFPDALRPEGWTWAVDPDRPTVRTAHKPYVAGDNYVLVIDGFLVSPNVAVQSVATRDHGFEATDHNPVTARFRAR